MSGDGLQAAIEQELSRLFCDCGEEAPADVLEYLVAGLVVDDDADADELSDSLAGFCPAFSRLQPATQRQLVADLLARVVAAKQQGRSLAAAPPKPSVSLAAVAAEALQWLGTLSVSSAASSECGDEEDAVSASCLSAEQTAAVATLREMAALPAASDAFLAHHVLVDRGGGDVEAAAAWMLECPDLAEAQAAWDQARARAREERAAAQAARDATKKQIVERFQLQAVPEGSGAGGKGKPPPLKMWGASGGGSNAARFRDGRLVSTRGEKFVIERVGEERDGGSRGKVFTKGKRGKGFV